jgi:hypothetical protein
MTCKLMVKNEKFKIVMTVVLHLGLSSRIEALGLKNSDPENISVSEGAVW